MSWRKVSDGAWWQGHGTFVDPSATIGKGTRIGANCYIGPGVTVGRDCRIQSGAVIGEDGFGYGSDGTRWEPRPHPFSVQIGDDVHVGANAVIARGSWRDTTIGRGTRIDALAFIAHNCAIGEDCMIVAKAELSGSVNVGDGAWIGPHACVMQRLTVGHDALVGMGAVVIKDVAADVTVAGNPARVINDKIGVRSEM